MGEKPGGRDAPKAGKTSIPVTRMERWNHFNYFSEIEEYFWKKRGAHLLVSPLDWAIMEAWQKAGVPLEAVLKGIDRAFESYSRSRRGGGKPLKSLAYCADAVLEATEEANEASAGRNAASKGKEQSFRREEIDKFMVTNIVAVQRAAESVVAGQQDFARKLREIGDSLANCRILVGSPGLLDLEDLERRLTVLDEKLLATLLGAAPEELMLKIRREVDSQLAAYRRRMKAEQISMVERQYVQKRLLEEFQLPRFSLFYFS